MKKYVAALLIALLAAFLSISLVSYCEDDNAFTNASWYETKNILKAPGAYSADLIQFVFGKNSWSLILLMAFTSVFVSKRLISSKLLTCLVLILIGMQINFIYTSNPGLIGHLMIFAISGLDPIIIIVTLNTTCGLLIAYALEPLLPFRRDLSNDGSPGSMCLAKEGEKVAARDLLDYPKIGHNKISISSNEATFKLKASLLKKKPIAQTIAQTISETINSSAATDAKFALPSPNLLNPCIQKNIKIEDNTERAKLLEKTLRDFGVVGKIISIRQGPVVSVFELEPSAGTKSSRIIGLSDDIARSLSAMSARIAVVPGKNAIGIELPNSQREVVALSELIKAPGYQDENVKLPIILGKTIDGHPSVADLAKMPHLLIAGTTGSGKSVAINAMILSLIYRLKPEVCKFIMIDPKMLELSIYDNIPHLLSPVVTEPKKAIAALKWVVKEMENRYRNMSGLGVRNISGLNQKISEAKKLKQNLENVVQVGFDADTGDPIYERTILKAEIMPYIVVIVDEMADLMLVAGKEIESLIQRLAQMARAAGIHLILATQRPSVDVITGVIKANFPTRISFAVSSKIDSRTILGEQGAEQLLGMGDMLYMSGGAMITRIHGPFVSDEEVQEVVSYLKTQSSPKYIADITYSEDADYEDDDGNNGNNSEQDLYQQAVNIAIKEQRTSISYIQRQLKIGYNRAANLVERMEKEGVVSPPNSSGKRELLKSSNIL